MFQKTLNSFKFALKGFGTVWREETNFQIQVVISVIVLFVIFYFDFTFVERAISIFAISMVLTSEINNTAIEDLCNKIEPNQDPIIGKVKDMTSAFVLVSSVSAIAVG